ncbi:hypothetical protein [Hymenobacter properus]|uniref:Uncharacterized protein n=1 Tax=Hymenobacter properus TaxID=2791026 RepID=A0A931BHR9_9BACT|nr:hypothetical protein [Hymenobacter properus]MBF9143794.1 hypothetical protein [Hymenobacter properus]MBR7722607.1 hypothetical protein [Microvirga sp. SRT04]
MSKIQCRLLRWGGSCLLLPLGSCQPAPYTCVFLRNTEARPVVVWLTGPGETVGGVFRAPGQYRRGYRNTLLYAPTLVRPTLKNVDRMHDSLAVSSGGGATIKFTVPAHATVWLGVYNRWGKQAFRPELNNRRQARVGLGNAGSVGLRPELKLQRADSSIAVLNGAALAKVAHTSFAGANRRLWLDI